MEHIKPQATHTVEHGHEASDVNVRLILAFGVFLFISGIVIHVALWGMYRGLERWHEGQQPPPNPMVQVQGKQDPTRAEGMTASHAGETTQEATRRLVATFPEPRLQPDEVRDFETFQRQQRDALNEYAWIDQGGGKVRIPVTRAMEIIAERGLPAAAVTPTQPKAQTKAKQR